MASTPVIYGPDGKTPLRQLLTSEIAAPSMMSARSVSGGDQAAGLTPERLAVILRAADDGQVLEYLELAEQIEERYLHYIGVLGTRKRQVSQLPITVEAASDDPLDQAKADLIREWLKRDTVEAELFDMLDAIGKGFSVTEIVWDLRRAPWLPEKLIWRDPRFFEPDRIDRTTLLLRGSGPPQPLPPYKFVQHFHPSKSGLPVRGGLAKPVAWAWLFQSFSLKDWVSFAHVYGFPVRLGRYQPGATEDDIRTLLRAVTNVSADAAAVIPNSMQMDFISAQAGSGGEVFERLCEYLDKQVSKAVLGQTGTTDGESGRLGGGGREHSEVRSDIQRADAKLLGSSLNRDLVVPIIDFNFGRPSDGLLRYPKIRIGREDDEKEFGTWLDGVERFVDRGGRVEQSVVRDRLGLPDPEPGAVLLQPAAAGVPPAGGQGAGGPPAAAPAPGAPKTPETPQTHFSRLSQRLMPPSGPAATAATALPPAPQDDIDLIVAAMTDEGWEPAMRPMLDPLLADLRAADSYEAAIAALVPALAKMDEAALMRALERAGFAVQAFGRTGADGQLNGE
jgi:phage gp29-like protein